jgi:hypothetical protein
MKETLKKFFEVELHYTQVGLNNEDDIRRRNDICWYARQRGLGAVSIAQMCGLDYKVAEAMYYEYCEELERMERV